MSYRIARSVSLIFVPVVLALVPHVALSEVHALQHLAVSRVPAQLTHSSCGAARDSTGIDNSSGFSAIINFPTLFARSTWHVMTAPARWRGHDWIALSLGTAVVCGVAATDGTLRHAVERNHSRTLDDALKIPEPLGSHYALYVLGAFGAAGVVLDNSKSLSVAADGFIANVLAADVITPALKRAAGRRRPFQTQESYDFRPFGGDNSFPSGHATRAFAVASVVASHYHTRWVRVTAYSLAGLVAAARIVHNVHFASDVTAGALIGLAVGRTVVRYNDRTRHAGQGILLAPMAFRHNDTAGVGLSLHF